MTADLLPRARPAAKQRLSDYAYDYVCDLLLDNRLAAGDRLSAEEIGTRLGISRYPVMEALKRAEAQGFLSIVPQVGCIVAAPETQEIIDFYAVFAKIEGEIAACAAVRRTDDELRRLAKVSDRLRAFIEEARTPEVSARTYRQLNHAFHHEIHLMARSEVMSRMSTRNWDRSDFYIATVRGPKIFADRIGTAHAEHEAVRAAIEAGDADAARRAMEVHLRATGETVSKRREELG